MEELPDWVRLWVERDPDVSALTNGSLSFHSTQGAVPIEFDSALVAAARDDYLRDGRFLWPETGAVVGAANLLSVHFFEAATEVDERTRAIRFDGSGFVLDS